MTRPGAEWWCYQETKGRLRPLSGPGRFDKPKDRAVITGNDARAFREMANDDRKRGTLNDEIIAKSRDDFVNRSIVIEEN